MIKPMILLVLLACLSFNEKNEIPAKQVKVNFLIYNAGIAVEGTLSKVEAIIEFNPNCLEESKIVAIADPKSINTGITIRDKHLLRSDYFDVKKFREIRLQSKSFRKLKKNFYSGNFDLTIKGTTHPIEIVFKSTSKGNSTMYSGEFETNRLDFGLGEKSPILGDSVKISFSAELSVTTKMNIKKVNVE